MGGIVQSGENYITFGVQRPKFKAHLFLSRAV